MLSMRFSFGWALVGSLFLHALILLPAEWWRFPVEPKARPLLRVDLAAVPPAPEIASSPEAASSPSPPSPQSLPPPAARPRELHGRALASAVAALAREEFYPREAIALGLEGRVILLLTLDESGRVIQAHVASTSGHAILDQAAVKAAARIGRLSSAARQVLLPVQFRLE